MNKCIPLLLLLLSSCSFVSKKNLNSTIVIANVSTNINSVKGVDLKLKTEIYGDSAVIQIFPIVGLNLATLLVKDENIYVTNNLNSTKTIFAVSDFDPDINFKKLLKLATKNKKFTDTIDYKTTQAQYVFTDYVNVKIINSNNKTLFLPRHVIINTKNNSIGQETLNTIIDYKLVKLNK